MTAVESDYPRAPIRWANSSMCRTATATPPYSTLSPRGAGGRLLCSTRRAPQFGKRMGIRNEGVEESGGVVGSEDMLSWDTGRPQWIRFVVDGGELGVISVKIQHVWDW